MCESPTITALLSLCVADLTLNHCVGGSMVNDWIMKREVDECRKYLVLIAPR